MTPEDLVTSVAIVRVVVPRLYYLLDIALTRELTKEEKIEARRLLPGWCDNSFERGK
jgi:hypothetical protein